MKRLALITTIATFGLTGLFAQDSPKQDIKTAGSDAKGAAEHTGKAVKKGATKSTHAAKNGLSKGAGEVEKGAGKVKDKTTTN